MEFKGQQLGTVINEIRKDKNITIHKLCDYCQISKATYTRFVASDGDIRLPVFMRMLSYLRITMDEMTEYVPHDVDNTLSLFYDVRSAVNRERTAWPSKGGRQELNNRFDEALRTDNNDGVQDIAFTYRLFLAALNDDVTAVTTISNRLYQRLTTYGRWSDIENWIIIQIIPYLDFKEANSAFERMNMSASLNPLLIITETEFETNNAYLGLFWSALMSGSRANLRSVAKRFEMRPMIGVNTFFIPFKKLVEATTRFDKGDVTGGLNLINQTEAYIAFVASGFPDGNYALTHRFGYLKRATLDFFDVKSN